ncbi:MAG TPA: sugar phosphate isomerase/epimerase family protein [Bryobacteraceae bacterium]|nr:sugar phosphate isomerase/epimerase family protein [Bryobacteraceae bacterium]
MKAGTTRRSFLASSGALFGARWAAAAKGHITKARLAAITDEIGRTQADAIAFAKQYGLEWVELRNVPESGKEFASLPEAELKGYAAELAANKLKVSLLKTSLLKFPWPEQSPDADKQRWDRRKDDLARAIAAAQILGTDRIRIFTGARVGTPESAFPAIARTIGEMAPAAESARVRLLIENDASQNIATSSELRRVLEMIPSKAVGFNWDPRNGVSLNEPLWPGYDGLPKARLWNMQIKAEALAGGPEQINWRKLMNQMQKDGFTGIVSLATEVFDGTFDKAGEAMRDIQHFVGELD